MTNKMDNKSITPSFIDPVIINNYQIHNDEASLVDLWLSLVAQKKVFFITTALSVTLAIIYILIMPETYTYKTNISIGTQAQAQLIQSPDEVVTYLDSAVIPKLLKQQHLNQPDKKFDVSASSPKKTNSVLLSSKGTIAQKEAIMKLHQQLVDTLVESHQDKASHTLYYLNEELTSSKATLSKLTKLSKSRTGNNESVMMQIINLENNIRATKQNIARFSDTRSAMGTIQSIKPTKSNQFILVISIVLSLFIGFFATLLARFLVKVKERSVIV